MGVGRASVVGIWELTTSMAEASAGKDSVTGHWEMMGIVLERAFPTFPRGFPPEIVAEFERRIGRGTLGNVVASGTEIIDRLGAEHVATGKPIVYTSADSVFQIAAHESVIPVPELYRICEIAFDLVGLGMNVGRVIARPFVGQPGAFKRTANRHDYALNPTGETLLDRLTAERIPVTSIGKVRDLFAGRGIARAIPSATDDDGMGKALADAFPEARQAFAEADDAFAASADAARGRALSDIVWNGPEEQLRLTEIQQPGILAVSVAAYRVLAAQGLLPSFVAGHSLGEYSANVAAGTFTFADAVRIVQRRGRYMQEAVPVGEGAMAAILGADLETVRHEGEPDDRRHQQGRRGADLRSGRLRHRRRPVRACPGHRPGAREDVNPITQDTRVASDEIH